MLRIFFGLVGLLSVAAFTPVAQAQVLYFDTASCALKGNCPAAQDHDINYVKNRLEGKGWCIDHSWASSQGYGVDGATGLKNTTDVWTIQRYLTCKGYHLDETFRSRIFPLTDDPPFWIYDEFRGGDELSP